MEPAQLLSASEVMADLVRPLDPASWRITDISTGERVARVDLDIPGSGKFTFLVLDNNNDSE
jgi:hypothetical protein